MSIWTRFGKTKATKKRYKSVQHTWCTQIVADAHKLWRLEKIKVSQHIASAQFLNKQYWKKYNQYLGALLWVKYVRQIFGSGPVLWEYTQPWLLNEQYWKKKSNRISKISQHIHVHNQCTKYSKYSKYVWMKSNIWEISGICATYFRTHIRDNLSALGDHILNYHY